MHSNGLPPPEFHAPETAAAVFARALRARWPLVVLVTLAALGGSLFMLPAGARLLGDGGDPHHAAPTG